MLVCRFVLMSLSGYQHNSGLVELIGKDFLCFRMKWDFFSVFWKSLWRIGIHSSLVEFTSGPIWTNISCYYIDPFIIRKYLYFISSNSICFKVYFVDINVVLLFYGCCLNHISFSIFFFLLYFLSKSASSVDST